MSNNLAEAGHAFLNAGYELFDARKRFGYAFSEEPVELIYHDLLQRPMSAGRLLQNRHVHLTQVKAQSELDESRQNLATLIDNEHYPSHNADEIPSVESMITKIDSSVT